MKKTLIPSSYLFVIILLGVNNIFGQNIKWIETIKVPLGAKLQCPSSFCVTEDEFFLIPDIQIGKIKMFEKKEDFLKYEKEFDGSPKSFTQPRYCFYTQKGSKIGVLDYGVRKAFIFIRVGKVELKMLKIFDCKKFGYDIKFAGDGNKCIVSGYITDQNGCPFDLYSIDIETGQTDYLLSTKEKYGLQTHDAFVESYYKKQILPAIGIKGFFDVHGNDIYYIWEGALRIIKFKLPSKTITQVFGQETSFYVKPDGGKLSESYIRGYFQDTWKLQETFSYVRNIYATSHNIFIIYETGKKNENDESTYRLQIYTIDGNFMKDLLIPGNPGKQMDFDKESNELYAISNGVDAGKGEFVILKYKISIAGNI